MPTLIPFFDKAGHQVAKLREAYPANPRLAAWRLALWAAGRALWGKISGEVCLTRPSHRDEVLHLAFLLRGGIGDVVLNLAWMDALVELSACPCSVDIYTNTPESCMKPLCFSCPYVGKIHTLKENMDVSSFDAVFDVMQNPQLKSYCGERLHRLSPPLLDYARSLLAFQSSHSAFYLDECQAMGLHYAEVMGNFRRGQADFNGALNLKDSAFTLLPRLSWEELARRFHLRPGYITLQREAGALSTSLKLWDAAKYTALLEALRRQRPSLPVVLLGREKNFPVPAGMEDQVTDLRGRTDFDEFMALVRHARLHIGCEGVVPHMRHYLRGGPSLVLFGPSCARMLGYPENEALSGTECPNGCEGILPVWQKVCLKGYGFCRSLEEITVEQVMARVRDLL